MAKDCTETNPMAQIERHFFVCENARPAGAKPSCGARGSAEIATALQEGLGRHPELWGRIAVTSTGCLGPCFEGPTIVVYPEAVWHVGGPAASVPEVVDQPRSGARPLDRVRRNDAGESTACRRPARPAVASLGRLLVASCLTRSRGCDDFSACRSPSPPGCSSDSRWR